MLVIDIIITGPLSRIPDWDLAFSSCSTCSILHALRGYKNIEIYSRYLQTQSQAIQEKKIYVSRTYHKRNHCSRALPFMASMRPGNLRHTTYHLWAFKFHIVSIRFPTYRTWQNIEVSFAHTWAKAVPSRPSGQEVPPLRMDLAAPGALHWRSKIRSSAEHCWRSSAAKRWRQGSRLGRTAAGWFSPCKYLISNLCSSLATIVLFLKCQTMSTSPVGFPQFFIFLVSHCFSIKPLVAAWGEVTVHAVGFLMVFSIHVWWSVWWDTNTKVL